MIQKKKNHCKIYCFTFLFRFLCIIFERIEAFVMIFLFCTIKSLTSAKRKRIVFSNFESCKILLLTDNVEILNNLSLLEVWCYSEFTHQKQIKTFEARAEG
jgi:hypothetical protein